MEKIEWVSMCTTPHDLITLGYKFGMNNAGNLTKEILVDRVNKKIAAKHGIEVPADLVINKPTKLVAKTNSTSKPASTRKSNSNVRVAQSPQAVTYADPNATIAIISGKKVGNKIILANRKMVVTNNSGGIVKGFLIGKDGSLQKSEITIAIELTNLKLQVATS